MFVNTSKKSSYLFFKNRYLLHFFTVASIAMLCGEASAVRPECAAPTLTAACNAVNAEATARPASMPAQLSYISPDPTDLADHAQALCEAASAKTLACCSDPTTCLGSSMGTFLSLGKKIATYGAIGTALVGTASDVDVGSMCKATKTLAEAVAALSAVGTFKCISRVMSCRKTCNMNSLQVCQEFAAKQAACNTSCTGEGTAPFNFGTCPKTMGMMQKWVGLALARMKKKKVAKGACIGAAAGAVALFKNAGQMALVSYAAKHCENKASERRGNTNLAEINPTDPTDPTTFPDDEHNTTSSSGGNNERGNTPGLRGGEGGFIVNPLGSNGLHPELELHSSDDDISSTDDNTSHSGGGGDDKEVEKSSKISIPGKSRRGSQNRGLAQSSSAGNSGGSYGLMGRSGEGNITAEDFSKEDNGTEEGEETGEGGFGGGGGGASSYKASGGTAGSWKRGRRSSKIAGLSKKELKKAKEGAKRSDFLGATGIHQSIFERINKRFQKICGSKKGCHLRRQ